MSRWVLLLRNNEDDLNDVQSWVYHESFESRENANEKGIEFCKMHEEALIDKGLTCEYDAQSLFVRDDNNDGWWFICSYDVYPLDFPLGEEPEV